MLSLSLSLISLAQTPDLYKKYNDELESARKLKDFDKLASSYFKLALYEEEKKRNYERSFEYFRRALEFYEFNQDTVGIRESEFHLARQLLKNDMVEEALEEFNRLKTYYQSTNNRKKVTEIELQLFKLYFGELDIDNAKRSLDFIDTQLSNIKDSPLHTEYIISQIQYNKLLQQYDLALDLSNECYQKSMDSGKHC